MNKMDGASRDLTAENIKQLKALFPEAVTEKKIDFEVLKSLLGGEIEDRQEFYKFTWNGKETARRYARERSRATLRPCKSDSVDWDTTQNLYIEGDNLEVLKLLQGPYHRKVKMIYIDPPYNIGKELIYPDNFRDSIANYKALTGQTDDEGKATHANPETSGRYHTDWLNMMYPRLILARNLLKDDGVIFISIDDVEVHNLRKICDEIFGEENFVGEIIWQSATDNNPRQISVEHEYILCFAKNLILQSKWSICSKNALLIIEEYENLLTKIGNKPKEIQKKLKLWIRKNQDKLTGVSHYSYVDQYGVYYPGNSSNTKQGGYQFDIIHPVTQKVCKKPNFGYRWPETTFASAAKKGDIEWGLDENVIPKIKKRIESATDILKCRGAGGLRRRGE